jgi:hypothetical protein
MDGISTHLGIEWFKAHFHCAHLRWEIYVGSPSKLLKYSNFDVWRLNVTLTNSVDWGVSAQKLP